MSKFIEIPVNGEKCIINLDAIQSVCPLKGGGCEIYFLEGSLEECQNPISIFRVTKTHLGIITSFLYIGIENNLIITMQGSLPVSLLLTNPLFAGSIVTCFSIIAFISSFLLTFIKLFTPLSIVHSEETHLHHFLSSPL